MQEAALQNNVVSNINRHTDDKISHGKNIQHLLNNLCEETNDISEGVVLLEDGKQTNNIAHWPQEQALNPAITNTINMAIKRQSSVKIVPAISASTTDQACIIASPIIVNQKTIGAIALAMNTPNNKTTTERLSTLEQKATIIASLLIKQYATTRPADASKLMLLQQAFLAQVNLEDALIAVVNELANQLKFDRVCIGLMKKQQIEIKAISNQADFVKKHALTKTITAAMEESADQLESVIFPPIEHDKPRIHLAHQALNRKTSNAVCCMPLIHEEVVIGGISLEHHNPAVMNKESILWFENIAHFLAPLVALKIAAEQPWLERAKNKLKETWSNLASRDNHQPKIIAGIALLLLACSFIPVTHRIGASAHIEGATQRVMSAPVDGYIQKAYVRPGDAVKKGALLVDLADQDLMLEKQKWESEIIQQENNFSGALARQDRTQYAISQAKATQARAELALINQSLSRAHIKAPIDGIILDGDLSQSLGAPVKLGDKLMTIAPQSEYRIMVDIDEREINDVKIGQKGALALTAMPTDKVTFTVKRITPMASVKNGSNTYEVEASLVESNTYLRPGLQGVAKINVGDQPLIVSLTHRLVTWCRLTMWKWGI